MRFQVHYAHPATGREFDRVVEADSAEAARGMAGRGMLVSGVRKLPTASAIEPDDGDVAMSELDEASIYGAKPTTPAAATPGYQDIISGASLLRLIANILAILGILIVVGGIYLAMRVMAVAPQDGQTVVLGTSMILGAFITAVVFFVAAVLVRLAAACSVALRDIARNSFRR